MVSNQKKEKPMNAKVSNVRQLVNVNVIKRIKYNKGASQLFCNWDLEQRQPFRILTLVNKSHGSYSLVPTKNKCTVWSQTNVAMSDFLVKSSEKFWCKQKKSCSLF